MLTMELDGSKMKITYQNISEIIFSYYLIDLEVLFSRNPFLLQGVDDFGHVLPNQIESVQVNKSGNVEHVVIPLPEKFFKNKCLSSS